ncbi:transmembrane protein 243-like [Tachypleus tridentatus]|uniref:transmembrane protein 243-like n=1 Tax=Tachypleus tridentatus TaxID=6853 RepID=UPI003FD09824
MNPSAVSVPAEQTPLFGNQMPDRPLFGETTTSGRLLNLIVGTITCIFVAVTLICACATQSPLKGVNIYFSICICFVCISHIILIFWYRQGDVDPKFRYLIYFNAISIFLLCVCGNIYFFRNL